MTLDQLIREYLVEIGEDTTHKYRRFLQYGISGLREFNLDTNGVPTTVILPVNANDTVNLPDDYINYIKIAICSDDGNLHALGFNPNMCLPRDLDDCGNEEANTGGGTGGIIDSEGGHFLNNEQVGRYFGLGGGTNSHGYYKIDKKNNWISLQNYTSEEIWLEYLAKIGRDTNGEFQVHPYLEFALKQWMAWLSILRNPRHSVNQEVRAKHNFLSEKRKANKRFGRFTFEEAVQAKRRTFSLTVKL